MNPERELTQDAPFVVVDLELDDMHPAQPHELACGFCDAPLDAEPIESSTAIHRYLVTAARITVQEDGEPAGVFETDHGPDNWWHVCPECHEELERMRDTALCEQARELIKRIRVDDVTVRPRAKALQALDDLYDDSRRAS